MNTMCGFGKTDREVSSSRPADTVLTSCTDFVVDILEGSINSPLKTDPGVKSVIKLRRLLMKNSAGKFCNHFKIQTINKVCCFLNFKLIISTDQVCSA